MNGFPPAIRHAPPPIVYNYAYAFHQAHPPALAAHPPAGLLQRRGGPTTGVTPTSQSAQPTDTPLVPPTQTPIPPPTATPVPLAALVNGEPLTLAEYEAELARYNVSMSDAVSQAESGTELATDAQQVVLDELVGQMLLAQSARAQGFVVDQAALQARLNALSTQLGGAGVLQEWLTAYGYTDADFRAALRRSVEAA